MGAFEKIRELVILDLYFSGRMEIISMGEKGNESMLHEVKKLSTCILLLISQVLTN